MTRFVWELVRPCRGWLIIVFLALELLSIPLYVLAVGAVFAGLAGYEYFVGHHRVAHRARQVVEAGLVELARRRVAREKRVVADPAGIGGC